MGSIKVMDTGIDGLFVIEPKVFGDSRGYFCESYNKNDYDKAGIEYDFVQDNVSKSCKGVLRGLHFQREHPQAKLVWVLEGEVFDVAVDLRRSSKTFGKWFGVILSSENHRQLMIPRGFAHGFLVLSDTALFSYKCDDFYHPEDAEGIIWDDPDIGIDWPFVKEHVLSEKDMVNPPMKDVEPFP